MANQKLTGLNTVPSQRGWVSRSMRQSSGTPAAAKARRAQGAPSPLPGIPPWSRSWTLATARRLRPEERRLRRCFRVDDHEVGPVEEGVAHGAGAAMPGGGRDELGHHHAGTFMARATRIALAMPSSWKPLRSHAPAYQVRFSPWIAATPACTAVPASKIGWSNIVSS